MLSWWYRKGVDSLYLHGGSIGLVRGGAVGRVTALGMAGVPVGGAAGSVPVVW